MRVKTITTDLLVVHQVNEADVYKDIARINEDKRGDIPEGTICTLSAIGTRGNSKLVQVRGLGKRATTQDKALILLDDITRNYLHIECQKPYSFTISPVGWLGQFRWACHASEPGLRIAARLGLYSFVLGILSLVLSILTTVHSLRGGQ